MRVGTCRASPRAPPTTGDMPALSPLNGLKRPANSDPPAQPPSAKRPCLQRTPSDASAASTSAAPPVAPAAAKPKPSSSKAHNSNLEQQNAAALAKIDPLRAYEKAMSLYRYLANDGAKLFLQRNLAYNRRFPPPKASVLAKTANGAGGYDFPLHLALDLDSVADLTAPTSPVEVSTYLLRAKGHGEEVKGRPDLDAQEATLELVGRQRMEISEGRKLKGPSVHLPPLTGSLGRRESDWLLLSLKLLRDAESLTSGGRSLRNVAQRRSIRAQLVSGSELCEGEEARLICLCPLSSRAKAHPALHKPLSLPLLPHLPELDGLGSKASLSKDAIASLRQVHKSSFDQEVGTPHLKVVLRVVRNALASLKARSSPSKASSPKKNGCSAESSNVPAEIAIPPRLLYRFTLSVKGAANGDSGGSSLLTEADNPSHCPICRLGLPHLYGLLSHLRFCHGRLSFVYQPAEGCRAGEVSASASPSTGSSSERLAVIEVGINPMFDGRFEGSSRRAYSGGALAAPARLASTTELVVHAPAKLPRSLSLDAFRQAERPTADSLHKTGHARQYFDSVSLALLHPSQAGPGLGGEAAGPGTSGRQTGGQRGWEWLQTATCRNLADYSDVNEGEKALMMGWNLFAMRHANRFISKRSMEAACLEFLSSEEGRGLVGRQGLARNAALHLASLHNRAFLSLPAFHRLSALLQRLSQQTPQ